jgi:hypothetical protein
MKTFLDKVWYFLQETGRTRAAAAMARSGNFAGAQELMR